MSCLVPRAQPALPVILIFEHRTRKQRWHLPFWQMSYTADSLSWSLLTLGVLVGSVATKLVFLLPSVWTVCLSHASTGLGGQRMPSLLHLISLGCLLSMLRSLGA